MKLSHPLIPVNISQPFAANYNPYYAQAGLSGHSGEDFAGNYGQPIYASIDSEVYSIMNKDNPDPMKFRCVFTIFKDENGQWYELSYGHCSKMYAVKGQILKAGDYIADVGNTGDVWSYGHAITREEKLSGSTLGSHLHFQLRPLCKASERQGQKMFLWDGEGYVNRDGESLVYKNDYMPLAACVDPQPYLGITETDLNKVLPNNLWLIQKILDAYNKFISKKSL